MTKKAKDTSAPEDSGKKQALDLAISQITKQFGSGSIMKLGESRKIDVELLPSGSLSLDLALGGGYPKGRIIEIYGPESSGKTTLALHAIAEIQKEGGQAAFIDAEHALDPSYAKKIGVDTDNLFISQPDNGEQALEICETLVRSGAVDLIVVDSVAALVPQAEIDGDMGDAQMGLQARLMSQAMRKLTGIISKSKATVIFINQIRMKIGVMFGNPETTTGGNALKFYASVRLDIRRVGQIKAGEDIAGNRTKVKIVKNKIAAPFRIAEFDIMYNEGISKIGDILDLAIQKNIIEKAGAFLKYNGETIAQGREAAKALLKEKPELLEEIETKVRASAETEQPFMLEIESLSVNDRLDQQRLEAEMIYGSDDDMEATNDYSSEFNDVENFTITKITAGVRDPNRVNVFLDGHFAFSLDIAQIVELNVKVKQCVTPERLKELREASEFGKLYQRTLEWLLTRPHSIRETSTYLKRRKFKRKQTNRQREREQKPLLPEIQDKTINLVMERLLAKKYLDDLKFAKFFVENRYVRKGISQKRLKMELRQKGVDEEYIKTALDEVDRPEDEELLKVIKKKRKKYSDDFKLIGYLTRQGFDLNRAKDVVANYSEETSDEL